MKKKITVIGIWLIALSGVAFSFYDLYGYYSDNYHDGATFFDLTMNQELLYWAGFVSAILIALGLILRVKLARLIALFLSYFSLFNLFMVWVIMFQVSIEINSFEVAPLIAVASLLLVMVALLVSLMIIYLLSNDEALKLFSIKRKSNKLETVVLVGLALLAVLPSLFNYVIDYIIVSG